MIAVVLPRPDDPEFTPQRIMEIIACEAALRGHYRALARSTRWPTEKFLAKIAPRFALDANRPRAVAEVEMLVPAGVETQRRMRAHHAGLEAYAAARAREYSKIFGNVSPIDVVLVSFIGAPGIRLWLDRDEALAEPWLANFVAGTR